MLLEILSFILLGFLFIRFAVTCYNFLSNPVLPLVQNSQVSGNISICIPARNEEKNIGILLQNLLNIDQENILEILVLDDASTDSTKDIIYSFSDIYPKIKYIEGKELPSNWLGKNWACHQLASYAKGDFICFLDADVSVSDHLFSSCKERFKDNISLLSLFPEQEMKTIGERVIVPLMHFLLLNLLPLRLVKNSINPSFSAANGQCMFFKRSIYLQYQFHQLVKSNVLDDVTIMKIIKQNGLKGEVLLGNNLIFCRMYHSLKEGVNGFSKNIFNGFGNNILGFSLYFLLVCMLWIPFFLYWKSSFVSIIAIIMIVLSRVLISLMSNQNVYLNLILHPIQIVFYQYIAFRSVIGFYNNSTTWKGRKI